MPNLFVYGELRKWGSKHDSLNKAACHNSQCWVNGALYAVDEDVPVMGEHPSNRVYGELYEVTETQLQMIDQMMSGFPDSLYQRVSVQVSFDTEESKEAFIYKADASLSSRCTLIPSGDWLVYQYLKHHFIRYFAYGSCMDKERFRQANVAHYFKNVEGRGVLGGFRFQFSRSTDDGGKADLVEKDQEKVEGIVYRIPIRATSYLYRREGVYSQSYRPAIVPVEIHGEVHQALTFIGMEKSPETAPTALYGREILRGGENYLSESYLQMIRGKIHHLQG
ncbi:gamma-glutamylcyclotransferase [Lentibacillus juripiscarius]|uniref:Gamma-glutamylcyclotransferase n=1 Tax=Lentibacillus juripiscarius TaxID=257446 RepID=A0ABW5V820_9BACI